MKKELLAGTKGLVTTLMVAMVVVCTPVRDKK